MGCKYSVDAARYPYKGFMEWSREFDTLDEALTYVKKCQSEGYVIINIKIRDFEVNNEKV